MFLCPEIFSFLDEEKKYFFLYKMFCVLFRSQIHSSSSRRIILYVFYFFQFLKDRAFLRIPFGRSHSLTLCVRYENRYKNLFFYKKKKFTHEREGEKNNLLTAIWIDRINAFSLSHSHYYSLIFFYIFVAVLLFETLVCAYIVSCNPQNKKNLKTKRNMHLKR